MVILGTQMHIVTFIFVCIELVIFFYLVIYRMARPDDHVVSLNLVLIFLLLTYNITGGLLPDSKLPGTYFQQEVIAYGTGFITPCYFPHYVFKAFSLTKMRFHAQKGVLLFLVLPYVLFVIFFAITDSLLFSQKLLILPVLYAIWVVISLYKAIRCKYKIKSGSRDEKLETAVLLVSLTPWIALPVITYFNVGQAAEVLITNFGFLLLFALQVNRSVTQIRIEHLRLIESEQQLLNWNIKLQDEVEKRTAELEKRTAELERIHEQRANYFVNLIHETKTPLMLLSNYLDEYIDKHGSQKELDIVKEGIDKITNDVVNLFDIERFTKGSKVYSHNHITDFSALLKSSFPLFEYYGRKQGIVCSLNVENNIYVKADPNSIIRIINNIVENAIKFTDAGGQIDISLAELDGNIVFSVLDTGVGIDSALHTKIFEAYYQINNRTTNMQGMGLGLPIVKKVVDSLGGQIIVDSSTIDPRGTKLSVVLNRVIPVADAQSVCLRTKTTAGTVEVTKDCCIPDVPFCSNRETLLLVEDNKAMLYFLSTRLARKYNIFFAYNGAAALKMLYEMPVKPDLILSDILMDHMDGFAFLKAFSEQEAFNYIPVVFLTAKITSDDRIKGLKLGAVDYILKPFSLVELNQKIDTILRLIHRQHKALLTATVESIRSLNKTEGPGKASSSFEKSCKLFCLTVRETEVAQLMLSGKTYRDIGVDLYISEKTVAKHVQNIFQKTAVSNKIELYNKLIV